MERLNDLVVMDDYNEFGKWIKETRINKGMKQKELCEKVDIVIEHLSKIENGHRIPSRILIEKIVDELDYEFVLAIRKKKHTDSSETDILDVADDIRSIKVSMAINVNGEYKFFLDDINIPVAHYDAYLEMLANDDPDADYTVETEIMIQDDINEAFGIDWSSEDDYSDQVYNIYNPNAIIALREKYVGKQWCADKSTANIGGWINYRFKTAFLKNNDAMVTLPVQINKKGVITYIKEPKAEVTVNGVSYEVIPGYVGIYDAMDCAIGKNVNLMHELERMRKVVLGDDQFIIEGYIRNYGMTLDQACEKYKEIYGK